MSGRRAVNVRGGEEKEEEGGGAVYQQKISYCLEIPSLTSLLQ